MRRLVEEGAKVTVVDSMLRGEQSRYAAVADQVETKEVDIRVKIALHLFSLVRMWLCTWLLSMELKIFINNRSLFSMLVSEVSFPS